MRMFFSRHSFSMRSGKSASFALRIGLEALRCKVETHDQGVGAAVHAAVVVLFPQAGALESEALVERYGGSVVDVDLKEHLGGAGLLGHADGGRHERLADPAPAGP